VRGRRPSTLTCRRPRAKLRPGAALTGRSLQLSIPPPRSTAPSSRKTSPLGSQHGSAMTSRENALGPSRVPCRSGKSRSDPGRGGARRPQHRIRGQQPTFRRRGSDSPAANRLHARGHRTEWPSASAPAASELHPFARPRANYLRSRRPETHPRGATGKYEESLIVVLSPLAKALASPAPPPSSTGKYP